MTNLQLGSYTSNFWGGGFVINITGMTGKVVSVQKTLIFYWYYDIAYRPICIGRNDYRYRYIGCADMGNIGRYFISANTDMPTLPNGRQSLKWLEHCTSRFSDQVRTTGQLDNSATNPFPGPDVGSERAESDNHSIKSYLSECSACATTDILSICLAWGSAESQRGAYISYAPPEVIPLMGWNWWMWWNGQFVGYNSTGTKFECTIFHKVSQHHPTHTIWLPPNNSRLARNQTRTM